MLKQHKKQEVRHTQLCIYLGNEINEQKCERNQILQSINNQKCIINTQYKKIISPRQLREAAAALEPCPAL